MTVAVAHSRLKRVKLDLRSLKARYRIPQLALCPKDIGLTEDTGNN